MEAIVILSLIDVGILGFFAILRTYLNYKSVKLQETMLQESRDYWHSWEKRSKDVAREVLAQISTEDLENELRKRRKRNGKKSKRRSLRV